MEKHILFQEDTKQLKSSHFIFTISFYIGFISGVCAIIVYHIIKPVQLAPYYQPKGEEYLITIICLISAIYFSFGMMRFKNYIQYIDITKSELRFFVQEDQISYIVSDLVSYEIKKNYLFYKEYSLNFRDKKSFVFISSKKVDLSNVLDGILQKNNI